MLKTAIPHRERSRSVVHHLETLCKLARLPNLGRMARGIVYIVDGPNNNAATLAPKLVGEDMLRMIRLMVEPGKTKKDASKLQ